MTKRKCEKCKWWVASDFVDNVAIRGQCQKEPPKIFVMGFIKKWRQCAWPKTLAGQWCGEFEPKEMANGSRAGTIRK